MSRLGQRPRRAAAAPTAARRVPTRRLEPWVDFSSELRGGTVAAAGTEWDGALTILVRRGIPDLEDAGALGVLPKLRSDRAQDYVVLRYGATPARVDVAGEPWNFHFAQSMPDGGFLLACARCRKYEVGWDRNGQVFDARGRRVRELLLGDGIEGLQTNRDGRIWASYFDEGVFGNFGWGEPGGAPPVGASGLVCFGPTGELLYRYSADEADTDSIVDCYALNVASEEDTWIYFYTAFVVVRIHGVGERKEYSVWRCPVHGARAFAVLGNRLLVTGGYDERDVCRLYRLERGGRMRMLSRMRFADEDGTRFDYLTSCWGRGPMLYFRRDARVYRVDVAEIG